MGPSTLEQLLLILAFVVPGATFQTVRARFAGESPQNRDFSSRALRALGASTVLALGWSLVAPDKVRSLVGMPMTAGRAHLQQHLRLDALAALAVLFLVPAALAWLWVRPGTRLGRVVATRVRRLRPSGASDSGVRYDPTVNAWAWAVEHAGKQARWIRVLDEDGHWHGGEVGVRSFFSRYPADPAVFIERPYVMSDDGEFLTDRLGAKGALVPCQSARLVEFLVGSESPACSAATPDVSRPAPSEAKDTVPHSAAPDSSRAAARDRSAKDDTASNAMQKPTRTTNLRPKEAP